MQFVLLENKNISNMYLKIPGDFNIFNKNGVLDVRNCKQLFTKKSDKKQKLYQTSHLQLYLLSIILIWTLLKEPIIGSLKKHLKDSVVFFHKNKWPAYLKNTI